MIAVDTNVIVRLLTGDDARQPARARELFESETIWLAKTVVLETEWVLRRLHGFSGREVGEALAALIALPAVRCEDETAVVEALRCRENGMDFADALHLASAGTAERFVTFDADFAGRARATATSIPVSQP